MDSPAHQLTDSEPDRPPGGTRRSGFKTPRKVQWVDGAAGSSTDVTTRGLDARGIDPEPFETLTDALERHRTHPSYSYSRPFDPRLREIVSSNASPSDIESQPSSPPQEYLGTHHVPGEAYIDENETVGLPGTTNLEAYARQRAKQVVQAHKRGFFGRLRHRKKTKKTKKTRGYTSDGETETEGETTDGEQGLESSSGANGRYDNAGVGVLSTLLTLYDHSDDLASTVTSGFSTPARSSFDDSRAPSLYEVPTTNNYIPPNGSTVDIRTPRFIGPSSASGSPLARQTELRPERDVTKEKKAIVDGMPFRRRGLGFTPMTPTPAPRPQVPGETAQADPKLPSQQSSFSIDTPIARPDPTMQSIRGNDLRRPSSTSFPAPTKLEPTNSISDTPTPPISSRPSTPPVPLPMLTRIRSRQSWTGILKDLPIPIPKSWSRAASPTASSGGTPTGETEGWLSEKDEKERMRAREKEERILEKEKERAKRKERRRRRKKAEIFVRITRFVQVVFTLKAPYHTFVEQITRHVAEIIQRQEFICKLARSMMMFGGPAHRLPAQIQATARVLDVSLSCMYLPDMMLISFDDATTGTSSLKLVKQGGAFDIAKLQMSYKLYWKVIHDVISVNDASVELDDLMRKPPFYNNWQLIFFGGMCSASICSVSFSGSFIDCLISFPLGCTLIIIQLAAAKHELYSNVFEITVALFFSFISAALASTGHFCYSAIAASSVVLILPGYIILCGIVELSSHNLVSGAVRVCFSLIYSLFLGFGLAIGSTAYSRITGIDLKGQDDITCSITHDKHGPWWQRTPPVTWAFLTVPMYSLWLSLRFYAPWNRKELPLLVAISCIGWATNHFTGLQFPGQNDVSSAAGALAVGFVSNVYARFFKGNAFIIMITAILFQLPSGVANGGLFSFVNAADSGQNFNQVYLSGFQTALQLVSVALGLTVGLGVSLVLVFPIQSRRRAAGIFSL